MLVVPVAVVVGVAAWQAYARISTHGKSGTAEEADSGQRPGKAALRFTRDAASQGTVTSRLEIVPVEVAGRSQTLRLTGTLIADEQSAVVSNASGIAAEVRVERGSTVKKNDVLVQIDDADAKLRLKEGQAMVDELKARLSIDDAAGPFNPENQPEVKLARAALELTRSNLRRASDLYGKKVYTTEAYDHARTEYELGVQRYGQALLQVRQLYQTYRTALTRLAMLEKAVTDTAIRAPFDGWVAEKHVSVGEQISAGMQATKVVTLVRINPMRLSLTVPQQNIASVRPGQKVRFQVDSSPNRTFEGEVKYITPAVTSDTRSLVVEAVVDNKDGGLRPGLFATAELELRDRDAKVFVPSSAVQKKGEVACVFVVRDNVAREQVVALGEETAGKVEVRSGLLSSDRVVARPEAVRDGDPALQ